MSRPSYGERIGTPITSPLLDLEAFIGLGRRAGERRNRDRFIRDLLGRIFQLLNGVALHLERWPARIDTVGHRIELMA
jgi:hypothetical protein